MPSFLRCPGPGKHEVPSIWITNDHQKGTSVFCALVLLASRHVKICTRTEESTTTFTQEDQMGKHSQVWHLALQGASSGDLRSIIVDTDE